MYLNLYSSCHLIKGYLNCSILDAQKGDIYIIDKKMYYYFIEGSIDIENSLIEKEDLEFYKSFLIDNQLGFLSATKIPIDKTNYDWDFPAYVSNAIVEYDLSDISLEKQIIEQLNEVLCPHIEVRVLGDVTQTRFNEFSQVILKSKITSVDMFVDKKNFFQFDLSFYKEKFFSANPKINRLVFFNSDFDDLISIGEKKVIIFTKQKFNNNLCGNISPKFFAKNIYVFSESQRFNTCLNRKVSIDRFGNIKNCLSFSNNFGNIKEEKIKDVIVNPEFTKYWYIKKDDITVCKDCEFRHVCTDCRAFIENPNDILSKPLKCGYNPYDGTWEEWSINPLKRKTIEYYKLDKF